MKQKRKNSRAKGAVGERELSEVIREFGWPARRGQQRSGVDQADVIDGPPGWHIEVKRVEHLRLREAWAQAVKDSPVGEQPVIVTRRSRMPWLAIVDLRTFLRTVQFALAGAAVVESHNVTATEVQARCAEMNAKHAAELGKALAPTHRAVAEVLDGVKTAVAMSQWPTGVDAGTPKRRKRVTRKVIADVLGLG